MIIIKIRRRTLLGIQKDGKLEFLVVVFKTERSHDLPNFQNNSKAYVTTDLFSLLLLSLLHTSVCVSFPRQQTLLANSWDFQKSMFKINSFLKNSCCLAYFKLLLYHIKAPPDTVSVI